MSADRVAMVRGEKVAMRAWLSGLRRQAVCLGALVLSMMPLMAGAWGISQETLLDLTQQQMMHRSLTALQDAVYGRRGGQSGAGASPGSALDLGRVGVTSSGDLSGTAGVDKLAISLYPRDEFVPRAAAIQQLLKAFHRNAEKTYGVPANHLATAVAVAVAGGWAAHAGQPFQDEWVKPLVSQIDQALRDDPAWRSMPLRSKVYMHQVLTGMGLIFMAEQAALQRQPDARRSAQLQRRGNEYLQALLRVGPQRLHFSRQGLQVR